MSRPVLVSIVLAFLTVATFLGVKNNGFVSYDDPDYLTSNPIVQKGITKEGLAWAFGKVHGEQTYWHPLTWVSHMLDVQLFGMNPGAHHLVSLGIHTLNVLLLFLALNSMTGALWRSALVAALFAVHPLQVESVAWATERKNVLSAFFFMLTLWCYVQYARRPGIGRYLLAVGSFAVGLMCKPALVPLPGVLLLMDYWPLRRLPIGAKKRDAQDVEALSFSKASIKQIILEKAPFILLAVVSSLLTLAAHSKLGMIREEGGPPRLLELENVVVSYARYIGKAILPHDLAVFYPFPKSLTSDQIMGSIFVLLAITTVAVWQHRRRPYLAVGWFWFLGVIIPTIGIVRVGAQAMADRFAYLPVIGLFIAAVWGIAEFIEIRKLSPKVVFALGFMPIIACIAASARQLTYWKNDYALFDHARAVTKENYIAYNALGQALLLEKKIDEALQHIATAQSIRPSFPDVYYSAGMAMLMRGNFENASAHFAEALRRRPNYPEARLNFALALQSAGRLDESIENYQHLLQERPDSAEAHLGIGNALLVKGRLSDAMDHFREAIRLNPNSAGGMARLAWILATHSDAKVRNGSEALRLAEEACRLTKYRHIQTVNTLAAAQAETGNFELAVRTADQAIALAKAEGETNLTPLLENLRDRYAKREPYRE